MEPAGRARQETSVAEVIFATAPQIIMDFIVNVRFHEKPSTKENCSFLLQKFNKIFDLPIPSEQNKYLLFRYSMPAASSFSNG